jgi:hypothetical protein
VIASLLCASAGPGAAPLVILGVVVAHLTTLALEGRLGPTTRPASMSTPRPQPTANPGLSDLPGEGSVSLARRDLREPLERAARRR